MKKRIMKNKKNLIILILVILCILEFVLYIRMKNNEKLGSEINLGIFIPFSQNNVLKTYDIDLKLKENLPRIEVASAFYPFAANLVQNIYSKELYNDEIFKMVSTSEAFSDIVNGKTDIIIATAPSDEQKKLIEKFGIDLEYVTLYFEPLAILVNEKNTVNNLSLEQIKKIYYDEDLNWNTYQLIKNNGSQTCFESIVKNNKIGRNHYEIKTMPRIINKIAIDKKGIGYSFRSYCTKMHINNNVKIINIDNFDIDNESYPLLFEVYFIYNKDNKNENIVKMIDWLDTENGREFIKKIIK